MDGDHLRDVLDLVLRFLHVVAGIAWIGASFYFVWLDNSLRPPVDEALKAKGVGGELWAVHAGAFYNPQKYVLAPPQVPKDLHWFYWESYSTWLSGFPVARGNRPLLFDLSGQPKPAARAMSPRSCRRPARSPARPRR